MNRRFRLVALSTVLAVAVLALIVLLLWHNSSMHYKSATIKYHDGVAPDRVVSVDDPAELRRLIEYMPGVGTRTEGRILSNWPTVFIDLTTTDGRVISISTHLKGEWWGENGGFHDARPGFGKFLQSLLSSPQSATTKGTL